VTVCSTGPRNGAGGVPDVEGAVMAGRNLGSISPTCVCAAFTGADPKNVKIQSSCQYLFALLRSACVKSASKMLMKLTPDCDEGAGGGGGSEAILPLSSR
jgi:hypothetical protein